MQRKTVHIIIKLVLGVLCLICLFDMPHAFYDLSRFFTMVGFGILAYDMRGVNRFWFFTYLWSAVLVNPFLRLSLGHEVWNVLDIVWVLIIIISIVADMKTSRKKSVEEPMESKELG